VFLLRTVADVDGIRALCAPGKRAVIVGGGFIGLEVAASLRKLDLQVTVLEGLPRVLARVTVPEISAFFERVHREAGVDLRTGVALSGFEGPADPAAPASHALLGDGSKVEADFFVIGIGLIPNTELAETAGLAVDNGIVVDEHTRSSDPDIHAAGDCTNHPSQHCGRRLRLESVPNAMEQARAAAAALVGKVQPYHTVPWFWSDQYDLKLQMVGMSQGYEQMVFRGDPATQRSFAVFYLKDGKVLSVDTVSRAADFAMAKKMVALRVAADPAKLADEAVPLKSFLPAS
jgi:3-phenylpropionate/trans-cinnamate dioxygenase ferredoxin reductase subunit